MTSHRTATNVLIAVPAFLLVSSWQPCGAQVCAFHELEKLTADDGGPDDQFGVSVSMNDNRVAIGAKGNEAVYVFRSQAKGTPSFPFDDSWVLEDKIVNPNPGNDEFSSYLSQWLGRASQPRIA